MATLLTYNPVVYLIEDVAQMDQCQFVYEHLGKLKRCKRDGKYRIGQTIFLCGYHMPGVGRRARNMKPIVVKPPNTRLQSDVAVLASIERDWSGDEEDKAWEYLQHRHAAKA